MKYFIIEATEENINHINNNQGMYNFKVKNGKIHIGYHRESERIYLLDTLPFNDY